MTNNTVNDIQVMKYDNKKGITVGLVRLRKSGR